MVSAQRKDKQGMISLLYPIKGRLGLFKNTIRSIFSYSDGIRDKFEILLLTSKYEEEIANYIKLMKQEFDIKYIYYNHPICATLPTHNPAYAFNLGSNLSKYDSIILTSPEILHKTEVIKQLMELVGKNILCRVEEVDVEGKVKQVLMGTEVPTRHDNPGMYFIGMFNKKDYLSIGGIDEEFMKGLGWEDRDFGRRFKSKYEFITTDDIVGIHQPHPRYYHYTNLYNKNISTMEYNKQNNIIIVNSEIVMGDKKYIKEII